MQAHACMHVQRTTCEDQFSSPILSTGDQTQFLSSQHFYLLSHLTGSFVLIIIPIFTVSN